MAKKKYISVPFKEIVPVSTVRETYRLGREDDFGNRYLVQTGVEDLHEIIQSGYSSCLDYILDRFLDGDLVSRDDDFSDMDQSFLEDALDLASAYVDNMEEAREIYGLSSDMSYDDIRAHLSAEYDKLKNMKNGGTQDAQTSQNESQTADEPSQKSEAVSEYSSPDTQS